MSDHWRNHRVHSIIENITGHEYLGMANLQRIDIEIYMSWKHLDLSRRWKDPNREDRVVSDRTKNKSDSGLKGKTKSKVR